MDGATLWVIRCRLEERGSWAYRDRGSGYLAAYSVRAAAEAHRDALERLARVERRGHCVFRNHRNPDIWSPDDAAPRWDELCSRSEVDFCDWLIGGGIEPPDPAALPRRPAKRMREWGNWWGLHTPYWDDAEFGRFWRGIDRWHFYELYELPLTLGGRK